MSNNISLRFLNDLKEFRQQSLRCVNEATIERVFIFSFIKNFKNFET